MLVTQALKEANQAYAQSFTEADDNLNNAQRRLINAMAEEHGTVFLGNINLYNEDRGKLPEFRSYPDEKPIYNFAACFVIPTNDDQLAKMILERDLASNNGTKEDMKRIDQIFARIKELNGHILTWS
jgi:hypothetical protein